MHVSLRFSICTKTLFPFFFLFFSCCSFLREQGGEVRSASQPSPPPLAVYITIDDGPLSGTQEVIDVIKELKLPVTFLMVGEHAEQSEYHKKLLQESETSPLICVGNHSYTHAHDHYLAFYSDPAKVVADFEKNERVLHLKYKIARLPGRNIWNIEGRKKHDLVSGVTAAQLLADRGYKIFGWDLEWHHDAKTAEPVESVDTLVRQIMAGARHAFTPYHVVVLAHDEMFHNLHQEGLFRQLLERLKKEGVIFKTLKGYPVG